MGIGQIAECLQRGLDGGGRVWTDSTVVRLDHDGTRMHSATVRRNRHSEVITADRFISTLPLQALVTALQPRPPAAVLAAASRLRSRDLVVVAVLIDRPRVTGHTWIYVPERAFPFGRVHEPTNWSPHMAPAGKTLLVVEYFCFRGDQLWSETDAGLTALSIYGLSRLGLIEPRDAIGGAVQRVPNAYPLFAVGYQSLCETIYQYLDRFDNLTIAGRGGTFRYYNMDAAIESGLNAAETCLAESADPTRLWPRTRAVRLAQLG